MNNMRTFVMGDIHGNYDLAYGLLTQVGVMVDDKRDPEIRSIQIGDLIDGTIGSHRGDKMLLAEAHLLFDEIVMGNHEFSFLGGPVFHGMSSSGPITDELIRLVDQDIIVPSTVVDRFLLTHAGLPAAIEVEGVDEANRQIRDLAYKGNLFHNVSRNRGGRDPWGGILWADLAEPKNPHISQIFGHTPDPNGPTIARHGDYEHINIDIGAKRSMADTGWSGGLMIEEDGTYVPHIYSRPASQVVFESVFDDIKWEMV